MEIILFSRIICIIIFAVFFYLCIRVMVFLILNKNTNWDHLDPIKKTKAEKINLWASFFFYLIISLLFLLINFLLMHYKYVITS